MGFLVADHIHSQPWFHFWAISHWRFENDRDDIWLAQFDFFLSSKGDCAAYQISFGCGP
jgi:hypothetical protein